MITSEQLRASIVYPEIPKTSAKKLGEIFRPNHKNMRCPSSKRKAPSGDSNSLERRIVGGNLTFPSLSIVPAYIGRRRGDENNDSINTPDGR